MTTKINFEKITNITKVIFREKFYLQGYFLTKYKRMLLNLKVKLSYDSA